MLQLCVCVYSLFLMDICWWMMVCVPGSLRSSSGRCHGDRRYKKGGGGWEQLSPLYAPCLAMIPCDETSRVCSWEWEDHCVITRPVLVLRLALPVPRSSDETFPPRPPCSTLLFDHALKEYFTVKVFLSVLTSTRNDSLRELQPKLFKRLMPAARKKVEMTQRVLLALLVTG